MTEPRTRATKVVQVIPHVFRWSVEDDRIGSESDAHAVVRDGEVTLIDPLPIGEAALRMLGEIDAIVLTASCHQRSAWRMRRTFGVQVLAPRGAVGLEEEPDVFYAEGDLLPGALVSHHSAGPTDAMYALSLPEPPGVIFLADLLMHDGSGIPGFVPSAYQDAPAITRVSVRRLLDEVRFKVACFNHGPPIVGDARRAIEEALALDSEVFPEMPAP